MKNFGNIFFAAAVLICCGSAIHQFDKVRKQPQFSIIPPGTVWLRDSIFIDETEIRNLDYLEFLYWIGRTKPENYQELLPDTLVVISSVDPNDVTQMYYLRHPSYRDYPVVGISYDQAVAFCNWRSEMVNRFLYLKEHKELPASTRWDTIWGFPEKVRYRLPTKEEWEYAASAGLNAGMFPYGYETMKCKYGQPVSLTMEYNLKANPGHFIPLSNKARQQSKDVHYYMEDSRSNVHYGKPNCYGIYNLLGNVSELIADTMVKGFNYLTYLDGTYFGGNGMFQYEYPDSIRNVYYKNDLRYLGPQAWLGFRCACELLK